MPSREGTETAIDKPVDDTLDETALAMDKTIASTPPPSTSNNPTAPSHATAPKTISGTEETILPASEPPVSGPVVAGGSPPSTPPKDAGPTDDYQQLVTVDPRHYLLGSEVARGGMGRILRARDRRLGRGVAIKELLVRDPALALRFEREARITARLQHPAIVALHEAGRWPTGEPFFAMKHVSGRPLDKVIGQARTLRERLGLLANVIAVVDALAYAHSEGVVHRDLKPANVLVGDYGETVVIDWGLAKVDKKAGADDDEDSIYRPAATTLQSNEGDTIAGSVIGTPAYMPPEQAAGEKVDARADVYALGALLYHVLTGRPPYEAKTVETMLAKVLGGPPPPMQDIEKDVPPDLVAIVGKAMAREPADRFPTASEMAEELKRFQTGQLVTSHRYTAWELFRRWVHKNRGVVAVSSLAIVLLAAFGAFSVSRIVAARDLARVQEGQARKAQTAAELRANQVTLAQATGSLDVDPTLSLALLGSVTTKHDPSVLVDMRRIAADAASRGIAFLLRGNGRVHGLGISPDGKWLAAGGVDRKVHLWNVAERTERVLEGHEHPILDVTVTNTDVITIDRRGAVRRWSIANGSGSVVRAVGSDTLAVARLSRDGNGVATFRAGRTEIVDLIANKTHERREYEFGAWAPDGKSIVLYADDDLEIDRFELASGTATTLKTTGLVTAIATDGRRIIVGDEHDSVKDLTDGVMVSPETKHAGMVTYLALLADGTIVSASSDYEYTKEHHEIERLFRSGDYNVVIWPFEPHEAIRYRGHQGNIDAVATTPNGKVVASAGRDGTIRVWTRPTIQRRNGHAQLDAAVLSKDRKELAVVNNGSELDVHELGSDKFRTVTVTLFPASNPPKPRPVAPVPKPPGGKAVAVEPLVDEPPRHQVTQIAIADDGKHFVTLDKEPAAVAWDLTTNSARLLARDIATVAISHDGTRVITADRSGAVMDWDAKTGVGRAVVPATKPVTALAISRGGAIAIAHDDGTVEIVAQLGTQPLPPVPQDVVRSLAFSPDNKTLVGGGDGRALHVWREASSGATLRSWPGHDDTITKLVFSPDGKRVASASLDNTARVWSLEATAAEATAGERSDIVLRGHAGTIATIAWSEGSTSIVTAGDDRTVRLWDLPKGGHRIVARHGDYVVFAGFTDGERRIVSVDHANEIALVPDDLPRDEPGLRRWLAGATNYTNTDNARR